MVELRLNPSIVIQLQDGSAAASIAGLSPHQVLDQVAQLICRRQASTSAFSDWFERALDLTDADRLEDLDDLFVSYVAFCRKAEVELSKRLTFPRFSRSLGSCGLEHVKGDHGRPMRRGGRLQDWNTVAGPDPEVVDLAAFIGSCCRRDPLQRARSGLLHASYCTWAAQNERSQMSIKRFHSLMLAAGFRSILSNGRWWIGLSNQHLSESQRPLAPLPGGDALLPSMEA